MRLLLAAALVLVSLPAEAGDRRFVEPIVALVSVLTGGFDGYDRSFIALPIGK